MALIYQEEVPTTRSVDFMERLRDDFAELTWPMKDEQTAALLEIKKELKEIDQQRDKLCALNPKMTARYYEQHGEVEKVLAERCRGIVDWLKDAKLE